MSLLGLGFAILQLSKLRGETRAARAVAEAAKAAISRDLASSELTRLNARLQGLKELHRSGNRERSLDQYPNVLDGLREIRRRHLNLSSDQQTEIIRAITTISEMESTIESLDGEIP
ncbi:MAG: hypothetical protein BZY88_09380 [SAR202 cluster bacterium Io17-Chloro-G9]|nr:MAG: hypothetical protein BZY88_09380 [SAR202 cluster bacterium Io17-Chloro-G9]